MNYWLNCQYCNELVERHDPIKKATCFKCKMEKHRKRYHDLMARLTPEQKKERNKHKNMIYKLRILHQNKLHEHPRKNQKLMET